MKPEDATRSMCGDVDDCAGESATHTSKSLAVTSSGRPGPPCARGSAQERQLTREKIPRLPSLSLTRFATSQRHNVARCHEPPQASDPTIGANVGHRNGRVGKSAGRRGGEFSLATGT